MDKPKTKLLFEAQVCTRCSGSGSYSFNLRDGSMCYGCGGLGEQLTKRGKAAQAFLRNSLMRKVADLKGGEMIRHSGITNGGDSYTYAAQVVVAPEMDPNGQTCISNGVTHRYWVLRVTSKKFGDAVRYTFPTAPVELIATKEDRERALAFQATLTKAGKPAKR